MSLTRETARGVVVGPDADRIVGLVNAFDAAAPLIEDVRRRHRREAMLYIEGDHCVRCRLPWPCPEARLIEALDGDA